MKKGPLQSLQPITYWECRRKMGYKTPPHTALDDLGSILNKERGQAKSSFSKEDEADSDEDMADLVFRKAILPGRTGDFDKDFPLHLKWLKVQKVN